MPRTRRTELETEEALRTKACACVLRCARSEDDPLVFLACDHHERPGDIVAVQGVLRHANVRSTQRYVRTLADGRSVAGSWLPGVDRPNLTPEAA